MKARDYRARAREVLSGNWFVSALVVLVARLLGGAFSPGSTGVLNIDMNDLNDLNIQLSPTLVTILNAFIISSAVIGLIHFIIGGTIKLGHCRYLLDQHDGVKPNIRTLFSQFHQFSNGFCLQLLTGIFTFLWALLFVIPGILAAFNYAMAPFIQAEHPEYGARECIRRSKEMMRGHRWQLFCMEISFIGWSILSIFTLGIGSLFVGAYSSAAHAVFYRQLQSEAEI